MCEKAQPLFELCPELHVTILGPTHPDTLTCMECLAALYMKQGMYDEVEPLYGQCYMINMQMFGTKHPNTLSCVSNLLHCILIKDCMIKHYQ